MAKLVEKKVNWASVVPMALYFIRTSPCNATGHEFHYGTTGVGTSYTGTTIVQSWSHTDLGEIDLEDWVIQNAERVELAREKALGNNTTIVGKRKKLWDQKAKNREFLVVDEVLIRKPGMNLKLADSWEGPFTITRKNSPG